MSSKPTNKGGKQNEYIKRQIASRKKHEDEIPEEFKKSEFFENLKKEKKYKLNAFMIRIGKVFGEDYNPDDYRNLITIAYWFFQNNRWDKYKDKIECVKVDKREGTAFITFTDELFIESDPPEGFKVKKNGTIEGIFCGERQTRRDLSLSTSSSENSTSHDSSSSTPPVQSQTPLNSPLRSQIQDDSSPSWNASSPSLNASFNPEETQNPFDQSTNSVSQDLVCDVSLTDSPFDGLNDPFENYGDSYLEGTYDGEVF